jgi:hypothetical protein
MAEIEFLEPGKNGPSQDPEISIRRDTIELEGTRIVSCRFEEEFIALLKADKPERVFASFGGATADYPLVSQVSYIAASGTVTRYDSRAYSEIDHDVWEPIATTLTELAVKPLAGRIAVSQQTGAITIQYNHGNWALQLEEHAMLNAWMGQLAELDPSQRSVQFARMGKELLFRIEKDSVNHLIKTPSHFEIGSDLVATEDLVRLRIPDASLTDLTWLVDARILLPDAYGEPGRNM